MNPLNDKIAALTNSDGTLPYLITQTPAYQGIKVSLLKFALIALYAIFFQTMVILAQSQTYSFQPVNSLPDNKFMPDPFKKMDGSRVTKPEEWSSHREYLKQMLYFYLWGTVPPKPASEQLSYTLVSDTNFVIKGSTISARKLIYKITITRNSKSLSFDIAVWREATVKKYPTLIQNYRVPENHPYAAEEAVKRGYMFVQYNRTQIAPDDPSNSDRQHGIFALYPEYGFCTIAAWAWAAQPVIDVLDNLGILDMEKIIKTGHSRGGQTAVAAGILDERIDMICPSAGSVYADMSFRQRDPDGSNAVDIIERMDKNQPHWFNPRHYEFVGKQNKLPFDSPTWFALIAPRPFLVLNGRDDKLNNNLGTEAGARIGKYIYKWFGAEEWCRSYYRQAGINPYGQTGHSQGPEEFNVIYDFADEYFFGRKAGSTYNVWKYDPVDNPLLIDWSNPSSH